MTLITTTTKAEPPLDKPAADLILRSADGVDFHVRKAIMEEASSVFEDMFAVGDPKTSVTHQASSQAETGLPVVELTEDGTVLDRLLRFIYPVANPAISSVKDAFDLLSAASAYMVNIDITKDIVNHFEAVAEAQPLQAYIMAIARHHEDATRMAAKACLLRPCPGNAYVAELETITAGDLVRLRKYYMDCSAAVASACAFAHAETAQRGGDWFELAYSCICDPCRSDMHRSWYVPLPWWDDCVSSISSPLKSTPHPKAVSAPEVLADIFGRGLAQCPRQKKEIIRTLKLFVEDFTCSIEKAVNSVSVLHIISAQTAYSLIFA